MLPILPPTHYFALSAHIARSLPLSCTPITTLPLCKLDAFVQRAASCNWRISLSNTFVALGSRPFSISFTLLLI